jgi:hypothetical protein
MDKTAWYNYLLKFIVWCAFERVQEGCLGGANVKHKNMFMLQSNVVKRVVNFV